MQDPMLGVYLLIVFLAGGLLVFVPLMIRRAIKQTKAAKDFIPDFIRLTGLQQSENGFQGTYKGFPVRFMAGIGLNYVNAASSFLDNSWSHGGLYGRNIVYPKFTVELKIPGAQIPAFDLIEKISILRTDQFIQNKIEKKNVELPEVAIPGVSLCRGRIKIFTVDEQYIKKIVTDPELQRLLSDWYYAFIRVRDNTVVLILDDNNVVNKYKKRITTPHYMVQALDICARIAALST